MRASESPPSAERLSASEFWRYLAAASVLTDFAPERLRAIDGEQPDIGMVSSMLLEHGELIESGPAKGRWSLSDVSRRAALMELRHQDSLSEALAANQGDKPDNPTQRALEALLSGQQPVWTGRPLAEVIGLERAIDLCGPAIELPEHVLPALSAHIERLRLLEPLQRLVADGFAGRIDELKTLRSHVDELPAKGFFERLSRGFTNILDIFRHRPPLVLWGPGGVGKSTLLARFLLDHAGPEQTRPVPFLFLDFDLPRLDPMQPDTLLREAFRQIRLQFPEFAGMATALERAAQTRIVSEDGTTVSRSAHFEQSAQLREAFVELLGKISAAHESNLLLFVDTFEVVQRRGATPVFNVLMLAAELMREMPSLRLVIAGRAQLRPSDFLFADKAPPFKNLFLKGFDPDSGRVYLMARLRRLGISEVSPRVLDRIVSLVKGNPLSLRLAAQVFAKESLTAIEDAVSQARFDAAFAEERVQGMLHGRIIQYLPDGLKKIADPGLIVRRITPDVIADVLAEPCGLELSDRSQADRLFEELRNEVALVEPQGPGMLKHRFDVRLLMLPLLRKKEGDRARQIDERAVTYWMGRDDPEARAEAIYHLAWMEAEPEALEAVWGRGPTSKTLLEEALDEFEALDAIETLDLALRARIWLYGKVDRELPPRLQTRADQLEWERDTEQRAHRLLANRAAKEALKVLRGRNERSPASPLWQIEIEALKLLGRDKEALGVIERALQVAHGAQAPDFVHTLLMQQAFVLERMEWLDQSLKIAEETAELARSLRNSTLQFESGLMRARLLRKMGGVAESEQAQRELVALLDRHDLIKDLVGRPALLAEAAAELGALRPELSILAAPVLGLRESDPRDPRVAFFNLLGLGVAYARQGKRGEAIGLLEQSRSVARQAGYGEGDAMALLHLGNAHRDLGQGQTARRLYEESLHEARRLGVPRLEAAALRNLGTTYAEQGDFHRAKEYLEQALSMAREVGDLEGEGNAAGNLALACSGLGEWQRAIELFQHDLEIARETSDRLGERKTLVNMGTAYALAGDSDRALDLFTRSLRTAEELGDARGKATTLGNIGGIYFQRGEYERAADYFEKALAVSETVDDRLAGNRLLGNLEVVYRRLGRLEDARRCRSRQLEAERMQGDGLTPMTAQDKPVPPLDEVRGRGFEVTPMLEAVECPDEAGSPMAEATIAWLGNGPIEEGVRFGYETKLGDAEVLREMLDAARVSVDRRIKQTL